MQRSRDRLSLEGLPSDAQGIICLLAAEKMRRLLARKAQGVVDLDDLIQSGAVGAVTALRMVEQDPSLDRRLTIRRQVRKHLRLIMWTVNATGRGRQAGVKSVHAIACRLGEVTEPAAWEDADPDDRGPWPEILDAIDRLNPVMKKTIMLRLESPTPTRPELAKMMGVKPTTITRNISKSHKALRAALGIPADHIFTTTISTPARMKGDSMTATASREALILEYLPVAETIARAYGRRMRHDAATIDDHVGNAILTLVRIVNGDGLSEIKDFGNYIRKYVANEVHSMHVRSLSADGTIRGGSVSLSNGKPQRAQPSGEFFSAAPPSFAAVEVDRAEQREELIAAIGKLRESLSHEIVLMRHGWHLVYWGKEMAFGAIANAIGGISDETARMKYLHAVAELRGLISIPANNLLD